MEGSASTNFLLSVNATDNIAPFLLGYLTDVHMWELAQRITNEEELQQLCVNVLQVHSFNITTPRREEKDDISFIAREALKIWIKKQPTREEAYAKLYSALSNHGEKQLAEELRQWVTGNPTKQSKRKKCSIYQNRSTSNLFMKPV